jgi:photosystem II stability/assembly factor-like uncharacterized protein
MNDFVLENQAEDVIYALVASPHFVAEKLCYAARQSGLWVSRDGGHLWRSAFASLDVPSLPPATAVAVSAEGTVLVGVPGGLLTSNDGGQTWMTSALPRPAPFITTLVLSSDYQRDGVALAGSMEDGVFVSEDHGKSWNAWNFGLLDQNIFCIAMSPDFSHDKCVYAGTESGIFYSKNRGRSWRAINFPHDYSPMLSLALSPTYAFDGVIWAGTESNGLFCSQDHGLSWEQIGPKGSVNTIILSPYFPKMPDILMLLDDTLLLSRNRGQSWSAANKSLSSGIGFTTVIAPVGLDAGSVMLLGSDEGNISATTLE